MTNIIKIGDNVTFHAMEAVFPNSTLVQDLCHRCAWEKHEEALVGNGEEIDLSMIRFYQCRSMIA